MRIRLERSNKCNKKVGPFWPHLFYYIPVFEVSKHYLLHNIFPAVCMNGGLVIPL